jgi:UDP-glucose 4-epimerase
MAVNKRTLLITGGAGFIGSHTAAMLVDAGYEILLLDNFSNSHPDVIERLCQVTGKAIQVVKGDLLDMELLDHLFKKHKFSAVIHFAGLKSVPQSFEDPLVYYQNNVQGSLNLLAAMQANQCYRLVFSSSAAVYGDSLDVPVSEHAQVLPKSPYGRSKYMVETMLQDVSAANTHWQISILRYFNPVGAHPTGLLGDAPIAPVANLFPLVAQVASGERGSLLVYGGEYATSDGTGVRDYIHVMDLAKGHISALNHLRSGCHTYNLGTGRGYSVLEVIKSFEEVTGRRIKYEIVAPREGDIGCLFASTQKAQDELGWYARLGLREMVESHWHWHQRNSRLSTGSDETSR